MPKSTIPPKVDDLKVGSKSEEKHKKELEILKRRYQELQSAYTHLQERENLYRELLDSLKEVIFEIDLEYRLQFCNRHAYEFFGCPEGEDYRGINVLDFIVPEERSRLVEAMQNLFRSGKTSANEYMAVRKDGYRFPVVIHTVPIFRNNKPYSIRGVIMDISQQKRLVQEIISLSRFDTLTGLYNRHYFESEIERYKNVPLKRIGIVVCDVDGLKLVNDTMGHQAGDKLLKSVAELIQGVFGQDYLVARIGGDEFAVLTVNCDMAELAHACEVLKDRVNVYNNYNPWACLSISVGYTVQEGNNIEEAFKQADKHMYREKLQRSWSVRSDMVKALFRTLEKRSIITPEQTVRTSCLLEEFALGIGLMDSELNLIRLFARYHDIGKVGIPDSILLKPGPLTPQERLEMQRHCEIGQRIALSTPELVPISDWILKHHEWWNGRGYPLGLRRMEIPLECRLLRIVNSYEALTNDRPYRKAISHEQALFELKRCSGMQTDPYLTEKFLSIIGEIRKRHPHLDRGPGRKR